MRVTADNKVEKDRRKRVETAELMYKKEGDQRPKKESKKTEDSRREQQIEARSSRKRQDK